MTKVAITKCTSYDETRIKDALYRLIDNTDFPTVENKTILLKPNILSDSDVDKNITTNPLIVKAMADILKEKGAKKIYIGDSPGLPGPTFHGKVSGFAKVCEDTGAEWVDFSKETVSLSLYKGIKAPCAKIVFDVDLVFSMCKMKTHQLMYATGAVKNMFGVIPGLNKSPLHLRATTPDEFARLILSIYNSRVPDYAVMDGIISMEGAGPANGELVNSSLLLASSSPLALDKAEAIIMGYKPEDIPILREAERESKGVTDGIYTLLKPEEEILKDFKRVEIKKRGIINSLLFPFITRIFDSNSNKRRPAPSFDRSMCRLCSKCVDICPAKALVIEDKHVQIDTSKCIRCYCCHEMCPYDAIKIK